MFEATEVCYRVNDRDEIVEVNDAWEAFASGNAGEHLVRGKVLGRPLWAFISDSTTRLLYRDVLARVRSGHPVRFTLRCDSPDRRRDLEMQVSAAPGGAAEFRVRTLAEQVRQAQPLLDPARPQAGELLRVCGWCKKVDVGHQWQEVEQAVETLGLFDRSSLPGVTHGICDDCYNRMIAALGRGDGGTGIDAGHDSGH